MESERCRLLRSLMQMPFLFHVKAGCTAGAGEKVNSIVPPTSRLQLAGTFRVQVFSFFFFLLLFSPFPHACLSKNSRRANHSEKALLRSILEG